MCDGRVLAALHEDVLHVVQVLAVRVDQLNVSVRGERACQLVKAAIAMLAVLVGAVLSRLGCWGCALACACALCVVLCACAHVLALELVGDDGAVDQRVERVEQLKLARDGGAVVEALCDH